MSLIPVELDIKVIVASANGAVGGQASTVSYNLVSFEPSGQSFPNMQPSRWFPSAAVLTAILPVGSTGKVRTIGGQTRFIPDDAEQPRTTVCP